MVDVAFGIVERHVDNLSVGVFNQRVDGVDKAFVGSDVEVSVAVEHFAVQFGVDLYGILLNKGFAGSIVAFRLDALNLGKQCAEEIAQGVVVVDFDESFAITESRN